MNINGWKRGILTLALLLLPGISGCTPEEKAESAAMVQIALNNLLQNRQIVEQFVRDIKTAANPADPSFTQAVESYMLAREAYNGYLDRVESGDKASHTRSLIGHSPFEAQDATARFVQDATLILKPGIDLRSVPFKSAVIIPEDLSGSFSRLPKKARMRIIETLDPQVRWRSWGAL